MDGDAPTMAQNGSDMQPADLAQTSENGHEEKHTSRATSISAASAAGEEAADGPGPSAQDVSTELPQSRTADEAHIMNDSEEADEAPNFPQLSNNPPDSLGLPSQHGDAESEDGEPTMPRSIGRSHSPTSSFPRNRAAVYQKIGEEGVVKMHKFSLYETSTRYYVVGGDLMDSHFRILKIDRTVEEGDLSVNEDDIVYTKKEMNQLLSTIEDGNKSSGGLKLKCSTWGLLGFIRFTGPYYMLLITKRSQVAMIGGHYIYQIDGTELVPLTMASSSRFKPEQHPEEARFLGILNNLDLCRSFYFSYSYDITHTLQHNIVRERKALNDGLAHSGHDFNDMFVWNHYLLEPASAALKNTYDWCLPIMHGFVDQAALSVYGRAIYITIIARRSRFFAGARFLKRGANDLLVQGYVANDVETEQIVAEKLTTSFHGPGPSLYANPDYTSYVQHRGSIPLYWTQDNTGVAPKPDIKLDLVDPFYGAAALHFDNLFVRYGAPIYVLNLVKARERTPRESKLLEEYTRAVSYLNQFLPEDKKIIYRAWDMSRARDGDVIGTLESIAEEVMRTTSFFRNGDGVKDTPMMQNGIVRTNCIDCLDRTNAAQFVIGKRALGYQLHALGVISDTSLEYDTDAVNLYTHMYHDHGDTIAIQYGGSHLVNTMETYRKINHWSSHSRDMVESFKRYYNNSFLDSQRQEAYNLFLGNYIFSQGQPMLWDLATDYYLHHADPRAWSQKRRRNYIHWYTPASLEKREMPPMLWPEGPLASKPLEYFDDYWSEYYRPLAVSSFLKVFSYKINSTLRYIPFRSTQDGKYDLSPFCVRSGHEPELSEKKKARKGVTITTPYDDDDTSVQTSEGSTQTSYSRGDRKSPSLQRWLQQRPVSNVNGQQSILKEAQPPLSTSAPLLGAVPTTNSASLASLQSLHPGTKAKDATKALNTQQTLSHLLLTSLNPSVTASEALEYDRYIRHPQHLPLVVSTELPSDTNLDFLDYMNRGSVPQDALSTTSNFTPGRGDPDGRYGDEYDGAIAEFGEFLAVKEDPLTVMEDDMSKKRYKAYRQWLRGKSLFKQQRVDA
ncbi:MAG: hypothetical protein M1819_001253 [Sarea resinae]|nr:MAG: hypothetical protein M1819_001253 [Sarea resinae]